MSSALARGLTGMKIDVAFSAVLQKSPSRGGWTYVVWPKSAGKRVDVRLEERLAR